MNLSDSKNRWANYEQKLDNERQQRQAEAVAAQTPQPTLDMNKVQQNKKPYGIAKLINFASPSLANKYTAFTDSLTNAATLGLNDLIKSKLFPEQYVASKEIREENPTTSTIGGFAGSIAPFGAASKIASKLPFLSKFSNDAVGKIARVGVQEGIAGLGVGAIEGLNKGLAENKTLPEVAKETGETALNYGLGGFALGGGFAGAGELLPKVISKFRKSVPPPRTPELIPNEIPVAENYIQPPSRPIILGESPQGKFTVKPSENIKNINDFISQQKNIRNEPSFLPPQVKKNTGAKFNVTESPIMNQNIEGNINSPLEEMNASTGRIKANTTNAGKNVENPRMNPDDFEAINHVDDLPESASELNSYIKEAERRIEVNKKNDDLILLKIDLQLLAEAQKKLTRMQKNMQRFTDLENFTANTDNWTDKSAMSYTRETPDRNIIDTAGKEEGSKIKEYIFDKVKANSASRNDFMNEYRQRIANLKLNNKEYELVQKFGEGKIKLDELKQATNNPDKIINAVKEFRKSYNEIIDKVNKVLIDNFYEPVPYRKDYFPHFDGNDGILKQLGINIMDDTLPTDIAGLTADFRPGKNFVSNFLPRLGKKTTYQAGEGFDRYIEGVSKVIYHTEDLQKLRTLISMLRDKYKGKTNLSNFVNNLEQYTNNLAGKKALGDRGFESDFGRRMYSIIDNAKRRVGANMVALNPSSWLTNTIPLVNAAAENNKGAVAKALIDTMKNLGKNDGFVNKSVFLRNRVGSDPLYLTKVQKATKFLTTPFKAIDQFTSNVVTRAKYYDALSKGATEEQALKIADDWASKTMGDRSLGSMPNLFTQRNPLISLFTQFQLEVNNQLSHLFKDIPNEYGKAKMASVLTQVMLYDYLFNNMFEAITGNRPAFDPVGVVFNTIKTLGDDKTPNTTKARKITQDITRQFPFVGSFVGGGRLPVSAAFPDPTKMTNAENAGKEWSKPLYYLLPPVGGGQAKKTIEGLGLINQGGLRDSKGKLKKAVPPTIPNYLTAAMFGKNAVLKDVEETTNNSKRTTRRRDGR